MRRQSRSRRWLPVLSGALRPTAGALRSVGCRMLRSPWLWGSLLVLLLVLFQPLSLHPTTLPAGAHTGIGPLVALPRTAAASPQAGQVASDCGVTDLTSCINDWMTSFAKNTVAAWLQQQLGNIEGYGFMFQTPDSLTWNAPPVQSMYSFALSVVGAFLVVILAIAGFNHITGRSTAWSETLPQVIMCGVMAWAFQPFLATFIQLSNDFIFGMQFAVNATPTFPAYNAASNAFMDIVAFIFELLGDLILALEALARLALLDLLIPLSPLGIMCYALPQTRGWGRLWAESLTATILIQPIQTVIILIGAKMISMLVAFLQVGVPPIVQVLVGIVTLWVALNVPRMLLGRATHVVSDFQHELAMLSLSIARAAA